MTEYELKLTAEQSNEISFRLEELKTRTKKISEYEKQIKDIFQACLKYRDFEYKDNSSLIVLFTNKKGDTYLEEKFNMKNREWKLPKNHYFSDYPDTDDEEEFYENLREIGEELNLTGDYYEDFMQDFKENSIMD